MQAKIRCGSELYDPATEESSVGDWSGPNGSVWGQNPKLGNKEAVWGG